MERRYVGLTPGRRISLLNPSLRVPIRLPVRFGSNGTVHEDLALNVSTGGMFIKTSHYVRPGTDLHLEFSLEHHENIRAKAKVVWASEGVLGNEHSFAKGLGIQFVNLPLKAQMQLEGLSAAYHAFP